MECYNCGVILGKERICPNCGADLRIYRKYVGISNYLYNQALSKAKNRNLSGAVADLRLSLQYNKVNTNARNLLGLIYYETGEGVAAVREWLISKGYQNDENRAAYYLEYTKKDPAEKERINQFARKYNQVLTYCRQDSLDMAVIQLKKLMSVNPKLVKGWQLMALMYMQEDNLDLAYKALCKAEDIDRGNALTARYLKELTEQKNRGEGKKKKKAQAVAYRNGNDTIIQPKFRRDVGFWGMAANLLVGVVIGVAITWYLVVPGIRKMAIAEANTAVTEANNTIADKNQMIKSLEEQILDLNGDVAAAADDMKGRDEAAAASEALLAAYDAYVRQDIEGAGGLLEKVDTEVLSSSSLEIMTTLQEQVNQQYLTQLYEEGSSAYNSNHNEEAVELMGKVVAADETYNDGNAVYYLAQAYRKLEDWENAILYYRRVAELYPGTSLAYNANRYVNQIQAILDRQN